MKSRMLLPAPTASRSSDDPLIDIRGGAYAVSFSRRNP